MAKKIELIVLILVLIFSGLSSTVLASDDVEWVEEASGKQLYWGDSTTIDGYVITAAGFQEEGILLVTISKEGEELESGLLTTGMELEYDDEIKLYAQEVSPNYETKEIDGKKIKTSNWNPYVKLDILVRGEPEFDIDIETDKDSYDPKSTSDSRIRVTIGVKNEGDAKAENVIFTIDTGGLEVLSGKTKHTYTTVKKDETLDPINLTLQVPSPWEDTDFKITAKATCQDIKDEEYEDEGSKTITIEQKWGLVVSKSVTNTVHMDEQAYVTVTVRNEGICSIKNIELTDSLISGMKLQEDVDLNTTLSLKAGETAYEIFKYTLIPEKPGDFTLPEAVASFTLDNGESETISSDSEKTSVYGPNIILTKSLDKTNLNPGDELTVTLTVKNTGNVDASVKVTDTVPDEVKFISGEKDFSGVLKSGGGSQTSKYIVQMNSEGEIQLPPCTATFFDLEDYTGEVNSSTPEVVYVGTPESLEESSGNQSESTESANQENYDENNSTTGSEGEENESAEENESEEDEDIPGFEVLFTAAGLLGGAGLQKKGLRKKELQKKRYL